jgi:ParB-like chromosome segregation protein Spo0J
MQVERVLIESLRVDPDNARRHPASSIGALVRSLKRFGQQKPIVVDQEGVVVAGNGTLVAAQQLGWREIAVVRTTLDDRKRRAFALADNRTAELSDFDPNVLVDQLQSLSHTPPGEDPLIRDLGWTDEELEKLLLQDDDPNGPPDAEHGGAGVPPIRVTKEQREVFERALAALRDGTSQPEMTEGRAVELIAAQFLS